MPKNHAFPITTVFDAGFFKEPYHARNIREIFIDLLDSEAFDDKAWSTRDNALILDFIQNSAEQITDDTHIAFRQEQAAKFIQYLNELSDNPSFSLFKNSYIDGNTIVFEGVKDKEELYFTANVLCKTSFIDSSDYPKEAVDIIDALEDGFVSNDKFFPDVATESMLNKLILKKPRAAEDFSNLSEDHNLIFTIKTFFSLPIISFIDPERYQKRLQNMKDDLRKIIRTRSQHPVTASSTPRSLVDYLREDEASEKYRERLKKKKTQSASQQATELSSRPRTLLDKDFFQEPYNEYTLIEIFDDIINSNAFSDDAWSTQNGSLVFDFAQDAYIEEVSIRQKEIAKFVRALNKWMPCHIKNNTIVFDNIPTLKALQTQRDKLFPCMSPENIENPQEILDILNALHDGLDMNGNNFDVPIAKGSPLEKLLNNNDIAERFEDASDSWGLMFDVFVMVKPPILSYTRPETYKKRLFALRSEVLKMIEPEEQKESIALTQTSLKSIKGMLTLLDIIEKNLQEGQVLSLERNSNIEQLLLANPDIVESFIHITKEAGLDFDIKTEIDMPVMYITRPAAYQQYLHQMKHALLKNVPSSSQTIAISMQSVSVFDMSFFDIYTKDAIRELFDEILSDDVFGENAWSVKNNRLRLDLTQDKSGKIDNYIRIIHRREEARKFVNALNQKIIPCFVENNIIVFGKISTKSQLIEQVNALYPSWEKSPIDNPQEIIDIIKALESDLIFSEEDEPDATPFIKKGSSLEKLFHHPDILDRFEKAAKSHGLIFYISICIYPPLLMSLSDVYAERLENVKNKLISAIRTCSPETSPAAATTHLFAGQFEEHLRQNKKFYFFGQEPGSNTKSAPNPKRF